MHSSSISIALLFGLYPRYIVATEDLSTVGKSSLRGPLNDSSIAYRTNRYNPTTNKKSLLQIINDLHPTESRAVEHPLNQLLSAVTDSVSTNEDKDNTCTVCDATKRLDRSVLVIPSSSSSLRGLQSNTTIVSCIVGIGSSIIETFVTVIGLVIAVPLQIIIAIPLNIVLCLAGVPCLTALLQILAAFLSPIAVVIAIPILFIAAIFSCGNARRSGFSVAELTSDLMSSISELKSNFTRRLVDSSTSKNTAVNATSPDIDDVVEQLIRDRLERTTQFLVDDLNKNYDINQDVSSVPVWDVTNRYIKRTAVSEGSFRQILTDSNISSIIDFNNKTSPSDDASFEALLDKVFTMLPYQQGFGLDSQLSFDFGPNNLETLNQLLSLLVLDPSGGQRSLEDTIDEANPCTWEVMMACLTGPLFNQIFISDLNSTAIKIP